MPTSLGHPCSCLSEAFGLRTLRVRHSLPWKDDNSILRFEQTLFEGVINNLPTQENSGIENFKPQKIPRNLKSWVFPSPPPPPLPSFCSFTFCFQSFVELLRNTWSVKSRYTVGANGYCGVGETFTSDGNSCTVCRLHTLCPSTKAWCKRGKTLVVFQQKFA